MNLIRNLALAAAIVLLPAAAMAQAAAPAPGAVPNQPRVERSDTPATNATKPATHRMTKASMTKKKGKHAAVRKAMHRVKHKAPAKPATQTTPPPA